MLLLLILFVYICYLWTKRVTRRTDLRNSKLSFVTVVCLKMSWRFIILGFIFAFLVAWVRSSGVPSGSIEAASREGTETGLAIAVSAFPLNLLVCVFVALNAFHRRSALYILHSGQQQGPLSIAQIRQMHVQNTIPDNTVYRREGVSEWRPIAELDAAPKLAQRDEAAMAVDTSQGRSEEQHAPKRPPPQAPGSMAAISESGSSLEKDLRSLAA